MNKFFNLITLAIIGISGSFLMSCSEVAELLVRGGEKSLINAELPSPSSGPRVLLFAFDGAGYNELMHAVRSGQFSRLQSLLGAEKKDGLFEHGYSVPNAMSILPSTTVAAWTSVYTGEPPARTGIAGNEWFVREQMRFYAPGAVSVIDAEDFLKVLSDGLIGDLLQTPTLYEMLGLRSHVSLAQVYRGASLLTVPKRKVLIDFFTILLKGAVSDESDDQDKSSAIDQESVIKLIDALKEHGVPALQVVYLPGIDLFTHMAKDPLPMQIEYLRTVTNQAVGDVLDAYAQLGALDDTYVLFVSDHGHTPILDDDRHALGIEGEDEPPALLKRVGFRLRKFVLIPSGDDEQNYQATVAYQGAIAYIYLADRSTCPAEGDACDWKQPPRLEEDVIPVVRAFYEVNQTGNPIPELKGTLDLIFAREPRPLDQDALPFQIFDGKRLVPISAYLAKHPRPDLIQLEKRMRWLSAGPYGHRAGDILLLTRSGLERPIEERFYFAGPYRSGHGSPQTQDSHIPLILAHQGDSGEKLQARVKEIVGKSPSQLHVVPLVRALLGQ